MENIATLNLHLGAAEILTRAEAEEFLFREAKLLDDLHLDEWLSLFTEDGLYWVPIDERRPIATQGAIIYDTPLRREERVYHVLETSFPAQAPRSRTVHLVSNVIVDKRDDDFLVSSNQLIYEMRTGDFAQTGIGVITPIVSQINYVLRRLDGELRIAEKRVLLINRDTWQGNLTFIL
jgi:3-phenylpropionate/cinnamic acid dioxygenase small subunit